MFGYGFALSDVRVTLGDGREVDCLQKIHPVGQWVAAGFAGSVEIGFAMIDTLKSFLRLDDLDLACDPLSIADCWPAPARAVFTGFEPEARQHGCHSMLVSTHPQEHGGNPSWPRSYVHISKSPDFQAETVLVHKLGSIGCGEAYEPCRHAIERYSNLDGQDVLMQGEIGPSGGMGSRLGSVLTNVLMQAQPGGISSHLHYCWVYRGQIIIQTNDHSTIGRWSVWNHGSGIGQEPKPMLNDSSPSIPPSDVQGFSGNVFRMPQIATTWEELCRLLDSHDLNVDGCIA